MSAEPMGMNGSISARVLNDEVRGASKADNPRPENKSSLRLPSWQWAAVSALIAISVVVAASVFFVGSATLFGRLRQFDAATLGMCFALMLWQLGCRFLRWNLFTRALGLKIRWREAALFYAAAFGMTLTPGRIGEVLRLWFLEQKFGVRYRRIAGLYVADRVSDMVAYLVLLALGSASYRQATPIAWGLLFLAVTVILAMMHPRPLLALLATLYAYVGKGRNLVIWLRRAIRNTSTLFQPGVFLPGLIIGTIGWFAAPAVLTLSLRRLGIDFSLLHATAIYAIAALAGGSTMMPGGGGAAEAVMVVLLRASQVPLDDAVSAMLMSRLAFLWLPVATGTVLLPVAMRSVRTRRT